MNLVVQRWVWVGDWKQTLAFALWTGLLVTAVVLLTRKAAGAFATPLPAVAACLVTTFVALVTLAAQWLFKASSGRELPFSAQIAVGKAALLPTAVIGIVLVPGGSIGAAAYLGGLLAVLVALTMMFLHKSQSAEQHAESGREAESSREITSSSDIPAVFAPAVDNRRCDDLTQWMTRSRDRDGCEAIQGGVKLDFAAGQKHAVVHLSFSPPFAAAPRMECEVLDPVDVRVKIAAVHAYGARVEVRRSQPADQLLQLEIGFNASATIRTQNAA